jgi:hypothetical protein
LRAWDPSSRRVDLVVGETSTGDIVCTVTLEPMRRPAAASLEQASSAEIDAAR